MDEVDVIVMQGENISIRLVYCNIERSGGGYAHSYEYTSILDVFASGSPFSTYPNIIHLVTTFTHT